MNRPTWALRVGRDFDGDLADLKKQHYRKNRHAHQEFDRLIEDLKLALAFNPLANHLEKPRAKLATKSYPQGHAVDGAIFRNARFRMPGLDGAAEHGRVFFDVHHESRIVRLLGAYTHSTHERDLLERLLIKRLKQESLF